MSSLAQATAGYTTCVGIGCLAYAVVGRPRPRVLDAALVMSGLVATVVVVADLASVLPRPGAVPLTHLGYAATVPAVLPVTAGLVGADRGRWGNAYFATACAVLVVVLIRLVVTGRT